MNRREAILTLIALGTVPRAAEAQQAAKIPRIGYLASDLAGSGPTRLHAAFLQGLHDLGYIEGRNVAIEYGDARGKLETLPARAAELVARRGDVIFAPGAQHPLGAQQGTPHLP